MWQAACTSRGEKFQVLCLEMCVLALTHLVFLHCSSLLQECPQEEHMQQLAYSCTACQQRMHCNLPRMVGLTRLNTDVLTLQVAVLHGSRGEAYMPGCPNAMKAGMTCTIPQDLVVTLTVRVRPVSPPLYHCENWVARSSVPTEVAPVCRFRVPRLCHRHRARQLWATHPPMPTKSCHVAGSSSLDSVIHRI